jgi:hypothetical protein
LIANELGQGGQSSHKLKRVVANFAFATMR